MQELRELARTAGLKVVDTLVQRRPAIDPRFVLGKGKVAELVTRSKQKGADLIVFDHSLSGGQIRNIAGETDQKIVDRTQLILDIFAQHARSREGKIQVELAQLKYLLPRLTGRGTAISRLAGGIGSRGPGETKLETDRRLIRQRIGRLEKDIAGLSKGRSQRRALRTREGLPIVSIVGYTNAGKSTLLNRLTGSHVLAEDKLFATLDPSSRRLRFPRERDLIVTDTVGFIRDLPEDLLHAFRATLEELSDAHLLLHVVDVANPAYPDHIAEVHKVLDELKLRDKAEIVVFNKADLVAPEAAARAAAEYDGVALSALAGTGMVALVELLKQRVAAAMPEWRYPTAGGITGGEE
jgi:GTP-binding protein HflX